MKKFLLIAAALGFTSLSYTAVAQQDEKIEQLSQYLRSSDGSEAYHELTAEVEHAKNNKD